MTSKMGAPLNHFKQFQAYIYHQYGINYTEQKAELLQSKIRKVMRQHGIDSYALFFDLIKKKTDLTLLHDFQDEITIHKTDFFREISHFDYLKNNMDQILTKNPRIRERREIRVWSAACSTGEEPYTIAMVLHDLLGDAYQIKILGTDISRKVLVTAQQGVYPLSAVQDIDNHYQSKYLHKQQDKVVIKNEIRQHVAFRQFNLMHPFPFKNTFDVIFCRNVMIYFDGDTQTLLLEKFYHTLINGGILILGLSEALRDKTLKFKSLGPSIYRKT